MQLSKGTLAIIKNFSGINNSIILNSGNKIASMAAGRSVLAEAVVEETFPQDFAIYDLNEFLAVQSLFENPELDFHPKYVTISEGKNSIKYFAADISNIKPASSIKEFPAAEVNFTLSQSLLKQILSASSVIGVADFSVIGDGESMIISIGDKTNPTSSSFNSVVGVTDKTFKVNFKVENLKLIPGDYDVSISSKKISRFKAHSVNLVYYIAIEADSTFDFVTE